LAEHGADDHRGVSRGGRCAELLQDVPAVLPRHQHVQEDDVGDARREKGPRLFAALRRPQAEPLAVQIALKEGDGIRVVVDDHHRRHGAGRQREDDAAAAGVAFEGQAAPVDGQQLAAHRQVRGTGGRRGGQARQVDARDAPEGRAVVQLEREKEGVARHAFDGGSEHVQHHLPQEGGVAHDGGKVAGGVDVERDAAPGHERPDGALHPLDDVGHRHRGATRRLGQAHRLVRRGARPLLRHADGVRRPLSDEPLPEDAGDGLKGVTMMAVERGAADAQLAAGLALVETLDVAQPHGPVPQPLGTPKGERAVGFQRLERLTQDLAQALPRGEGYGLIRQQQPRQGMRLKLHGVIVVAQRVLDIASKEIARDHLATPPPLPHCSRSCIAPEMMQRPRWD